MVDQAELIGAAQAGDRAAFDELVRRTYVDTYTLALRLTANEEDARDVVQEAYLRAWKGIGTLPRRRRSSRRGCTGSPPTPRHATSKRRRRHRTEPLDDVDEPDRPAPRGPARGDGRVGADLDQRRPRRSTSCRPSCGRVVVLKDVYGLLPRGDRRGARHLGRRRPRCACTGAASGCGTLLYEETERSAHAV